MTPLWPQAEEKKSKGRGNNGTGDTSQLLLASRALRYCCLCCAVGVEGLTPTGKKRKKSKGKGDNGAVGHWVTAMF